MSERIRKSLVLDAQKMAIHARQPGQGLIMHTDRGSQYASSKFQQLLKANGMFSSMSKKGDPWDNAVARVSSSHLRPSAYTGGTIEHGMRQGGISSSISKYSTTDRDCTRSWATSLLCSLNSRH